MEKVIYTKVTGQVYKSNREHAVKDTKIEIRINIHESAPNGDARLLQLPFWGKTKCKRNDNGRRKVQEDGEGAEVACTKTSIRRERAMECVTKEEGMTKMTK